LYNASHLKLIIFRYTFNLQGHSLCHRISAPKPYYKLFLFLYPLPRVLATVLLTEPEYILPQPSFGPNDCGTIFLRSMSNTAHSFTQNQDKQPNEREILNPSKA